jgi:signal transduction histidine kinase
MRLPSSENVRWYALLVGLAAVLALLAGLQYRASRQVSDATTEQMRASLQGSLLELRQGLERELAPLCRELQAESRVPRQKALPEYIKRFERWHRAAAHPGLVADVFVWHGVDTAHPQFLRLNSNRNEFEAAEWPSEFASLRQRLQAMTPEFSAQAAGYAGSDRPSDSPLPGPESPRRPPPPPRASRRSVQGMAPDFSGQGPGPGGPDEPADSQPRAARADRSGPAPLVSLPWMIDQNIPALVHPVLEVDGRSTSGTRKPATLTWVVVDLNLEVLGHHILPELAQLYFGNSGPLTYELAVIAENAHRAVIYSSDVGFGSQTDTVPDVTLNLFGRPVPILGRGSSSSEGRFAPPGPPHQEGPVRHGGSFGTPPGSHDEGPFKIDPVHYTSGERDWEIIARHRKGSVEAAVTALYHRSLAINFGVLVVLATTVGMIIATSQRARRLAQLQMDFVASVSHELRTPLTGILSAAQNIADGLVGSKERMARYGTAILGQAQQLTDLVEQILLFSATQKGRHRYHFQLVDVNEVIDASLKSTSRLIRSAGFTVEQEIQPDLPQIMVDFKALSQCLQNLITNSVKYGGVARWMGIRAWIAGGSDRGKEIRITVKDKGIGIEREDLKRIFEQFYRSPAATSAQIHGSGLGLPLAKTIAEAMGGRLTVESMPQKGSAFTVHLPVKDDPEAGNHLSVTPEVNSVS